MAFQSISAVSPTDLWVGGSHNVHGVDQPAAAHWDGVRWTQMLAPMPPTLSFGTFNSISATSASDVWANVYAEELFPDGQFARTDYIEHWDGSSWSITSNPTQGQEEVHLNGIRAFSSNNVWAVGWTGGIVQPIPGALMLHWDGTSWNVVENPNPPTLDFFGAGGNDLIAIAGTAADDIWTIGANTQFIPQSQLELVGYSLVEHYTGSGG
jgi:hypothetical protein